MSSNKVLLSIQDATISFTQTPIFADLSFHLHQGARIALVGKNGAGKSTLMNVITGDQEIDDGERWEEHGLTIGYLHQDAKGKKGQSVSDYIFTNIQIDDELEKTLHEYKVDIVCSHLDLDKNADMSHLSGGQVRRAGLARALVEEPDILLLDEPTNHLDLDAIEWLENYLLGYPGTLMVISHDRAFLSNVTNKVFWLDRGRLKISPGGFKDFDEWSQMLLEQEERELRNRKTLVQQEVDWASKGVKARRKRNVRRLAQMKEMRDQLKLDESAFRRATQTIKLDQLQSSDETSRMIAEFYNVSKSFTRPHGDDLTILDKFSMRIRRGDRIGVLGKNGSGKTTFLKMLLGEMEPDSGNIKRKKEFEVSYFDQRRSQLNPNDNLQKTLCPQGGEYIDVMGKRRHVRGYLKDFMFDPSRAFDKVQSLSGGQKNRLMLAKILAQPKSCLILDEPTNDLDMETLDMLEEILSQYQGTLIIVSHDRDFLDQCVTKIIAFEGHGKIEQVIGGYSDYLDFKRRQAIEKSPAKPSATKKDASTVQSTESPAPAAISDMPATPAKKAKPVKLSYKDERDWQLLPGKIEDLHRHVDAITKTLSDPTFYSRDPDGFHEKTKELQDSQTKLDRYETRWLELDELKAG